MRVTLRRLPSVHRDQRGAVLMIVAISLVVLIGMLVLTADLGRMVASRRDFVRASDAASLAAAQQCAEANGEAAALAAANATATSNEPAATAPVTWQIDSAECAMDFLPAGMTELPSVRVGYERQLDMFFAPIFGISTANVGAEATAVWGPAANPNVAPIMVDFEALTLDCSVPQSFPPGSTPVQCVLEYPPPQVDNPDWGELVLERWGEEFAADVGGSYCSVDANTLRDNILNGFTADPPPPTWDCIDNGLTFSVWQFMEGRYLTFPVVDLEQSTGKVGGVDCTGAVPGCIIDTVKIVSYVCLDVIDARNQGSTIILTTEWRGACAASGPPDLNIPDLGVHGIRLVG